jgi:hypothetical protein
VSEVGSEPDNLCAPAAKVESVKVSEPGLKDKSKVELPPLKEQSVGENQLKAEESSSGPLLPVAIPPSPEAKEEVVVRRTRATQTTENKHLVVAGTCNYIFFIEKVNNCASGEACSETELKHSFLSVHQFNCVSY